MTPQEKSKDQRLRKNYGWTLEMYNQLAAIQDYKCAACGKPAKTMPLNVDHKHFHIEVQRCTPPVTGWIANVSELNRPPFVAKTKVEAMRLAREDALPHSVRGLLCAGRYMGCNRKLGRIDNIPWLEAILAYLRSWPAKQIEIKR